MARSTWSSGDNALRRLPPTGSSPVTAIAHLLLEGLADKAHHVWQLVQRSQVNLYIAITPPAPASDAPAELLGVTNLGELHIERQAQSLHLGHHVHKIRFCLVGDV